MSEMETVAKCCLQDHDFLVQIASRCPFDVQIIFRTVCKAWEKAVSTVWRDQKYFDVEDTVQNRTQIRGNSQISDKFLSRSIFSALQWISTMNRDLPKLCRVGISSRRLVLDYEIFDFLSTFQSLKSLELCNIEVQSSSFLSSKLFRKMGPQLTELRLKNVSTSKETAYDLQAVLETSLEYFDQLEVLAVTGLQRRTPQNNSNFRKISVTSAGENLTWTVLNGQFLQALPHPEKLQKVEFGDDAFDWFEAVDFLRRCPDLGDLTWRSDRTRGDEKKFFATIGAMKNLRNLTLEWGEEPCKTAFMQMLLRLGEGRQLKKLRLQIGEASDIWWKKFKENQPQNIDLYI